MSALAQMLLASHGAAGGGGGVPAPYANVLLHLQMEGADASTTFTDSSSYARTVTPNGNVQIDTAQAASGSASALFDGAGDYLVIASSTDLDLGDTYLCEASIRPASLAGNFGVFHRGMYTTTTNTWANLAFSWRWFGGAEQLLRVYLFGTTNADEQVIDVPSALTAANWADVAVHRTGTTAKVYVNNVEVGSASGLSTPAASIASLLIGRWAYSAGNEDFSGHLDNLRISKP